MTYVTCPTMRYHPAVVAQQAATLAVLSDNRFTLGLGAGENLNEHVIGEGWPDADQRQAMLAEAVSIIRALLEGGYVNFEGVLPGRGVVVEVVDLIDQDQVGAGVDEDLADRVGDIGDEEDRAGPVHPQRPARRRPAPAAQSALRASPGARACYDEQRDRGLDHDAALRALPTG